MRLGIDGTEIHVKGCECTICMPMTVALNKKVKEPSSMTPRDFVYWLQGLLELSKVERLDVSQVQEIKNHLELVLTKETPTVSSPTPNPWITVPVITEPPTDPWSKSVTITCEAPAVKCETEHVCNEPSSFAGPQTLLCDTPDMEEHTPFICNVETPLLDVGWHEHQVSC